MQIDYKQMLLDCLEVFMANYQCPQCAEKSAFHLEHCQNPLHELHDTHYFLETHQNGV